MKEDIIPKALPPHYYILANLAVTISSLYLYYILGVNEDYILIPVLTLGVIYGFLYFIRQCRSQSRFSIEKDIDLNRLLKRSIARYLIWLMVILIGYQFYLITPPYNTPEFRTIPYVYEAFIYWYLWLGIPYFALTLTLKSSRTEDFYDPAIRFLHVSKQISRQILLRLRNSENQKPVFYVLKKQYNRKVFLNLVSRAFFIPVMVGQFGPTLGHTLRMLFQELQNPELLTLLFLISAVLMLLDGYSAVVAYVMESRWLENRSRSVDLTIAGWFVCIICYRPINDYTSTIFGFAPSFSSIAMDDIVFGQIYLLYASKIIEVIFLMLAIYSDVSLGTSGANLTLKKLQTKGVYGIVRHPGYTSKVLMWIAKSIIYKKFWTAKYLFGMLAWGAIYALRALTEERHLKQFAEYREYCKKVKYRFFPWLF